VLWLRDFLQADFPIARVMSYGYKTKRVRQSQSRRDTPDHKTRVRRFLLLLCQSALKVAAHSARLGWADRETIFVAKNRNHIDFPTFIDAEDPTYVYIKDAKSGSKTPREFCLLEDLWLVVNLYLRKTSLVSAN
jgi:hypothetical protein